MHETTEVSFEALIYVLCLPIGLRVVGGAEVEFRTSKAEKELPKLTGEYPVTVRYDGPGQTMQPQDRIHE